MGLTQLTELFDVYNKSLAVVQPNIGEAFVCPICLQKFGREAIINRGLTLEHVPPRSIGSAIITLTCKQCNSEIGNRLQNQMKNYVIKKAFSIGRVPKGGIPARAEIEGQAWSMVVKEVVRDEQGRRRIKCSSLPTHVSPQVWPNNPSEMIDKKAHVSLRLRSSQDTVNVAYLHSAYLALFYYLGYPYITQRLLDPVRDKIVSFSTKGGIPHVIRAPGVYLDPRDRTLEIGLLWQSLKISCLTVVIAGELIVMPFLNNSYIRIFETLYEAYKAKLEGRKLSKRKLGIRVTPLLIDPDCKFSTGFRFEDGGLVYNNIQALKLVPN